MLCAQPPADPITDRLRYELARAQRDVLIAKQQYDAAAAQLKMKMDEANRLCMAQNAAFEPVNFTCNAEKKPDEPTRR